MTNFNLSSTPLFENAYTKLDAVQFLQKLQTLSDALFNIKIPYDKVIDSYLTAIDKKLLLEHCRQVGINPEDPNAFQKHLEDLKNLIEQQQVITLYLSVEPTTKMIQEISDWFVQNYNQKYFLEIHIKPEIIGGAVVVVNGIYKDYTLKKILDEKFSKGG